MAGPILRILIHNNLKRDKINEVKLIETQLIKFAFQSIPFHEGFGGKRALGFLLKNELYQPMLNEGFTCTFLKM